MGPAAQVQSDRRKGKQEFEHKITVAGGVEAVGRNGGETQFARQLVPVQGYVAAGQRPRPQRQDLGAPAAIGQPVSVTEKHLGVGQQPMRAQDDLGALPVRVAGQHGIVQLFRAAEQSFVPFAQLPSESIDLLPDEQPQVSCDLFVAAAAGVELASHLAHVLHQPQLDKVVDVFGIRFEIGGVGARPLADLSQAGENRVVLSRGQHAGAGQRLSVGATRSQFLPQQAPVVEKRALPLVEGGVGRLGKPPLPHSFHRTTTSCLSSNARTRAGNPRMRINPSASFWS